MTIKKTAFMGKLHMVSSLVWCLCLVPVACAVNGFIMRDGIIQRLSTELGDNRNELTAEKDKLQANELAFVKTKLDKLDKDKDIYYSAFDDPAEDDNKRTGEASPMPFSRYLSSSITTESKITPALPSSTSLFGQVSPTVTDILTNAQHSMFETFITPFDHLSGIASRFSYLASPHGIKTDSENIHNLNADGINNNFEQDAHVPLTGLESSAGKPRKRIGVITLTDYTTSNPSSQMMQNSRNKERIQHPEFTTHGSLPSQVTSSSSNPNRNNNNKDVNSETRASSIGTDPWITSVLSVVVKSTTRSLQRNEDLHVTQEQLRLELAIQQEAHGFEHENLWVKLGNSWRNSEDALMALQCYRKALSINTDNVDALLNVGIILYNHGYFRDAATVITHAVNSNPFGPIQQYIQATIFEQQNNGYNAFKVCKQILNSHPNFQPCIYKVAELESSLTMSDMLFYNLQVHIGLIVCAILTIVVLMAIFQPLPQTKSRSSASDSCLHSCWSSVSTKNVKRHKTKNKTRSRHNHCRPNMENKKH